MNSVSDANDFAAAAAPQARRAGRPRRLTMEQILDASLAIGLDNNLTMSAVAERLGVNATVLYGYVGGRDELIRFASARAAQNPKFPQDEGQHWAVYAAQHALALYNLLTGPGGLLTQYLTGNMGPERDLHRTETWLVAFDRRGFSAADGLALLDELGMIVLGGAVMRLNDLALQAAGGGYAASASQGLKDQDEAEFPLIRSQTEAFLTRPDVWRRTILHFLELTASRRGDDFPEQQIAALLGL